MTLLQAQATEPDAVPPDLLIPPEPRERRRIDRDLAAPRLDGALRRLARQEALCRHVLGRFAAAFLTGRRHLRLGFVRIADYARERLGMSGRELQELARVARALDTLRCVAHAFREGHLSWSHVRLLTTVATAEIEADWAARAQTLSVRGLRSTIGRTADPDDDPDVIEGEARVRFRLRCPRRVRRLWGEATELASRMSGTHLPAWRAAEAIAAEGLSGVEGGVAAEAPPSPPWRTAAAPSTEIIPWEAMAAALPRDIEALASAEFVSGDPFQLDAGMRRAVRALQRLDWQTGRLLALVQQLRVDRAFGCTSLRDYVESRLGLSLRRARALLALDRHVQAHPELLAAYRDGGLSLTRALLLVPVLHPATTAAWVARAQEVTLRRLEELVAFALETAEPGTAVPPPPAEGRLELPLLSEVQMCARRCDAEIAFDAPATVVALLQATIRVYTPPGQPVWRGLERLLEHVAATWAVQPRVRDPIFARDGWRCAVPACTARASLHDHHVVFRSQGGDNARDNRVAICAAHHLQGIHRMRIKVTGRSPHDLTWELGWRGPRPPLMRTHGDRYLHGAP